MSFAAILIALLLEQARPLTPGNGVHAAARAWVRWCSRNFDAGRAHHGWLAWGFAVGLPAVFSLVIHALLMYFVGWPVAVVWSIVVLYVTLGFRQFSHHFTGVRDALEAGDEDLAREQLAAWEQADVKDLPRSEIVRHVIERSVLAAHRHVFGVLFWFSVLAAVGLGPAGAVIYRLSEFVTRYWAHQSQKHFQPVSVALQGMANSAWNLIDWLPARVTALGFAVVGSFEEAIDAWRAYSPQGEGSVESPADVNDGIIIAATSGAINVRLGVALPSRGDSVADAASQGGSKEAEPGFHPGNPEAAAEASGGRQEPELAHLRSVVGLVWRCVVMWMVLLALLTMARLLG